MNTTCHCTPFEDTQCGWLKISGSAVEPLEMIEDSSILGNLPCWLYCLCVCVAVLSTLVWVTLTLQLFHRCVIDCVRRRGFFKPQRMTKGLWMIHGKCYDLSEWAHRHPGGALAVELGRNRDCTPLFEAYHMLADRKRLEATLTKFEVAPVEEMTPSSACSTKAAFGDSFHSALRQLAREHFKNKSHKMKAHMAMVCIVLEVLQIASVVGFFCGFKAIILLLPFISGLLAFNLSHEASHFAASSYPWVNRLGAASAPLYWNSTLWFAQHVVQHHSYTNDEGDVDLTHFLPWARASRAVSQAKGRLPMWLFVPVVLLTANNKMIFYAPANLLFIGNVYKEMVNVEDFAAGSKYHLLLELMAVMLLWVAATYVHGISGAVWLTSAASLASAIFVLCTQGAHLCEESMSATASDESWARHQVEAAMNFKPSSALWTFLTGGLNMQSLHHVMPGISASHYVDMWPKFEELCREHDVRLRQCDGIVPFFKGFTRWMSELYTEGLAEGKALESKNQ